MIHGMSPAAFLIVPMLGKHPQEFPRFRDCFTEDEGRPEYNGHIHVYTRTGGGNREYYADENNEMRSHPDFVDDFDDGFDATYASWIFKPPAKWKNDFDKFCRGEIKETSEQYKNMILNRWPKLYSKLRKILF